MFKVNKKGTSQATVLVNLLKSLRKVLFDKPVNVHISIGSISRPTFSLNHNAASRTTAMETYQT